MNTLEEIQQMIADCEHREGKLTEWEVNFIDSIALQVGRGNGLSPRQEETLERIWDRVTS